MSNKIYEGVSNKRELSEAIDNAVKSAVADTQGADIMINWELKTITGTEGGIAGSQIIKVTIEA